MDVVISATQKGLGAPPGLSVCLISKRAIETLEQRKTPVASYYINWERWLPIMRAYEAGQAKYFATRKCTYLFLLLQICDFAVGAKLGSALGLT